MDEYHPLNLPHNTGVNSRFKVNLAKGLLVFTWFKSALRKKI